MEAKGANKEVLNVSEKLIVSLTILLPENGRNQPWKDNVGI